MKTAKATATATATATEMNEKTKARPEATTVDLPSPPQILLCLYLLETFVLCDVQINGQGQKRSRLMASDSFGPLKSSPDGRIPYLMSKQSQNQNKESKGEKKERNREEIKNKEEKAESKRTQTSSPCAQPDPCPMSPHRTIHPTKREAWQKVYGGANI